MTTRNTIAPVLLDKLPEFTKELYPRFVQFMQDYLEFLEQDENFVRIILDWHHNMEPTNNVEPYIDALLRDLGFESGQNLAVDKHLILHLLRDFYLARGSEASFKFLFRALFNEDVSIHYPRDRLLVPSHATYGERHFIFTSANNRDTDQYRNILLNIQSNGGVVTGLSSGTRASIESITIQHGSGQAYLQIEILLPNFEFDAHESVIITSGETSIVETVKPVLKIKVTNPGAGYTTEDQIAVTGPNLQGQLKIGAVSKGGITGISFGSTTGWQVGDLIKASAHDGGFGFSAKVQAVNAGQVTQYKVINPGYNYTEIPQLKSRNNVAITGTSNEIGGIQQIEVISPFVDFINAQINVISSTGSGAVIEAETVTRWSYNSWADHRGFIGENSTLTDSDKYQQYSYTIVSAISASNYDSFVTEMLHPAGYVKGSSYEIVSHLNLELTDNESTIGGTVEIIYENDLSLAFTSEFDIEDIVMIVNSDGEELTTNTGSEFIIS